jgi:hypothetical protein
MQMRPNLSDGQKSQKYGNNRIIWNYPSIRLLAAESSQENVTQCHRNFKRHQPKLSAYESLQSQGSL